MRTSYSLGLLLLVSLFGQETGVDSKKAQEAGNLCRRIAEIKVLPLKPAEGTVEGFKKLDPVYGEFRALRNVAVPCLIDQIVNETVMRDPRQSPRYGIPVRIGDTALFVFTDITGM